MLLQLYDSEDKLVCELGDDSATLGSAGVQEGWRINVVDRDPSKHKGEFEDLSRVEKYEMSAEDYAKRDGRQAARRQLSGHSLSHYLQCSSFHPPPPCSPPFLPRLCTSIQEENETGSVCREKPRGC